MINVLVATGIGLMVMSGLPYASYAQDELEQLRERFQEGEVLTATMHHTTTDAFTGESDNVQGDVWIGLRQYRIEVENQRVVVDGEVSRVFNRPQNKVIISQYEPEEDDFAPSRFLASEELPFEEVDRNTSDEYIQITLESNDPFEVFRTVTLRLSHDLVPEYIEAVDQNDNRFETRFEQASFQPEEPETFMFSYPDDAEIIDMRN